MRSGTLAWGLGPLQASLLFAVLAVCLLAMGCGGQDRSAPGTPEDTAAEASGARTAGGNAVEGGTQLSEGSAFTLNEEVPVPPDFQAAYGRGALIVVEFFEKGEDPFYPQGLDVDAMVNDDLKDLRSQYPEVEFFAYDIDNPGTAENGEQLDRGEYGTLAAQLDVGYTPYIAMLAPSERGNGYVVHDVFDGYTEQTILDQALFDLVYFEPEDDFSDVDVAIDRVELTEDGSGVEYVTMTNQSDERIDLSGSAFSVVNAETGEPEGSPDEGLRIEAGTGLDPGEEASIGRAPDVVDANGRQVVGTFDGAGSVEVGGGDLLALLDRDGAVVDTAPV